MGQRTASTIARVVAFAMALAWGSVARGQSPPSPVDPGAQRVVDRMAATLSKVANVRVVIQDSLRLERDSGTAPGPTSTWTTAVSRPNRAVVVGRAEEGLGSETYCDGTKVTRYMGRLANTYIESDAPADLSGMLSAFSLMFKCEPGVMADAEKIVLAVMDSSTFMRIVGNSARVTLVGRETVDSQELDHLQFRTDDDSIDVWVATGPIAWPTKVKANVDDPARGGARVALTRTLVLSWKTEDQIDPSEFVFHPPPGAERIESEETLFRKVMAEHLPKDAGFEKLDVRVPDLAWLADGHANLLLKQLKADPRWRVHVDPWGFHDLVAYRRHSEMGPLITSLHGFDDSGRSRVMYRFSFQPGSGQIGMNHSVFGPEAGPVEVRLTTTKALGAMFDSTVCVGKPMLWLEIYQSSQEQSRAETASMLAEQSTYLAQIRAAAVEIEREGFARSLIPEKLRKKGEPSLRVEDQSHMGVKYRAWVNPGKPGRVYIKIFDQATGKELSDVQVARESREHIGWSTNKDELFYAEGSPTVRAMMTGFHTKHKARVELWFIPEDKTDEVKLIETTRDVAGWEQ